MLTVRFFKLSGSPFVRKYPCSNLIIYAGATPALTLVWQRTRVFLLNKAANLILLNTIKDLQI